MHTEAGSRDKLEESEFDDEEEFSDDDTVVLSDDDDDTDNVGDVSVEINVEELVAEIEASQKDDARRRYEIRRRLEELQEQKQAARELEDTFNMDFDED